MRQAKSIERASKTLITRGNEQEVPESLSERRWKPVFGRRSTGYSPLDADGRPQDAHPGLEGRIVLRPSVLPFLFDRAPRTLNEAWADAATGRPQAFDLPGSISISTLTLHRSIPTRNVVGVLRGSDERLQHEHVILLAHLDHFGTGEVVWVLRSTATASTMARWTTRAASR